MFPSHFRFAGNEHPNVSEMVPTLARRAVASTTGTVIQLETLCASEATTAAWKFAPTKQLESEPFGG